MPKLDQCHNQVVHALEKAGWEVGDKPFVVPVPRRRPLQIDLYARRYENSNPQTIIIVEVKCFTDPKAEMNELYTAIGQYILYRSLLRKQEITDNLYLAVPLDAFESIIRPLAMPAIEEIGVKIIVVDVVREVITQWLE